MRINPAGTSPTLGKCSKSLKMNTQQSAFASALALCYSKRALISVILNEQLKAPYSRREFMIMNPK